MKRLKVLISAHEFSPYQGSECAVGWNLATRIARHHDVTVLYARGSQFSPDSYEKAIRDYFTEHENVYNIQCIPVDQPRWTLRLALINKRISRNNSSIGSPLLYFIGYRLWEKAAYRTARSLIDPSSSNNPSLSSPEPHALSPEPFVLCHHLTSVVFREPGYLWKLPVPFVWGPTGGATNIPIAFYPFIGIRAAFHEAFRTITNQLSIWSNLRIDRAIKRSKILYAFSAEDQKLFNTRGANRTELMLDVGTTPVGSSASRVLPGNQDLRVLWCGQLIRRKALEILLLALGSDPELSRRIFLNIVGDGPLRKEYEKLVRRSGLADRITFTGWVSRDEVFGLMQQSDVLVHTSYREAASSVIPEAFSTGIPVICHDIGGMSIAVTEDCGIRIPLVSYKQSVKGFHDALKLIADNRQLISDFKSGAFNRASELSWDSMGERISAAYNTLV